MASTTRSRNSKEHGFGIDPPPKIESVPPDSLTERQSRAVEQLPAALRYFRDLRRKQ
jgi:hypothetical protein